MYTPQYTAERDLDVIHALVKAHGFGTLIVPRADGQVEVTHLPFLLDEQGGLRVHVARANRIAKDLVDPQRPGDIVVVFHGPHGYVSPTWYASPKREVPTWNYAVAHAHITAPTEMTEPELERLLDDIGRRYETGPEPWRYEELPPEPRAKLLPAIVGFHLPVARWEAKLKLSQNRTPVDRAGVIAGLEARGSEDDRAMVALISSGR